MLERILDYVVIPSSSKEETRLVGRWLRNIFLLVMGILISYVLIGFYLNFSFEPYSFIGIALIVLAILLALIEKGQVRLASLLFCASSMVGLSFAAYRFGGVSSPSYHALVVVILISAMFMRGRMTVVATLIISLFGLVLLISETNNLFETDPVYLTPFQNWLSSVMIFITTAALLGIAARQVRAAIRRTSDEITNHRRTEQELLEKSHYQSALHETTLGIINRLELLPLLESILTRAEALVITRHGYIDLLTPEGQSVQQIVGHGVFAQFQGVIIQSGEGLSGDVLAHAETRVVNKYEEWPQHISTYAAAGFEAIAAIPLIANEQVLGVIGLAHVEKGRRFSAPQLEILEQLAELAALAIENARLYQGSQNELAERKRAQEALLRSEEALRQALDAADMGTWEWDIQSQSIRWSDNVYTIFGTSPDKFDGSLEAYLALAHPADRQKLKAQIEYSLQHPSEDYAVEHRIIRPGDNVRWLEGKGKIRLDQNGQPTSMAGTVTDITHRKTSEQALRKANQQLKKDTQILERRSTLLQVASKVSRAASAILDADTLAQEVVDLVCKRFNLYYVGLFLVNENGTSAQLRAATGKAGREMLARSHQLDIGPTSMVGWCIANRQARIVLDVGKDAVRFNNPILPGTRSELALPLISRGQVLGAITIQSKDEAAFSPEDIETFQTLADQLANAILNARLYNQLERELEERKRAEETVRLLNSELEARVNRRTNDLRASEEKFRALSENNPLQITRYDREGRYLYVNRVGRDDFMKPRDVIGRKLRDVLVATPGLIEFAETCIQQVFESSKPLNTEYALDDYYALWSLAPEFDPQGNVISVITSTMDITERKRMEEELHQRSLDLQAANRELEAFSYSVSHDLRAPLRAIDGFSRILMEEYQDALPENAGQHLRRISSASLYMSQLIDDILRLSRITRAELRKSPVDLGAMAESILKDLRSREPEHLVNAEIQPRLMADGDERLLRVALENLISNAWKFSGKNGNALIRMGVERQGAERVFFISDNGVGFDMAYADKLFGAFQRLHSSDEFPGTGIGLAITQRVIHKHGGRIWVQAETNKGATFYFTL